jgi:hypothetical protein
MGQAIYYSAYLVPVTLIACSSALTGSERLCVAVQSGIALLGGVAIVLSGTRASLLALAGGGIFLAIGSLRAGKPIPPLKLLAGAAAVAACTLTIAFSPLGKDLRMRVDQWRRDIGGPRLGVWMDTPALIRSRPMLGSGPETFAVEFRKVESAGLSRAYPDFYHETPHNVFLDTLCAQGIPGLLILMALFALPWIAAARGPDSGASLSLQSALVGIFIGSFFASFTLVTALLLWSMTGLIVSQSVRVTAAEPVWSSLVPGTGFATAARFGAITFLAVAFLLGAQDNRYAVLGDAIAQPDLTKAERAYAAAVSFSMGMPGYELWSSRQFAGLGKSLGNVPDARAAWAKAGDAASLAEERSEERFSAFYQSAALAITAGDLTRAELKARESIALAPNWYKPHLLRGHILQAMGRGREAADELKNGLDLSSPSQSAVTAANR